MKPTDAPFSPVIVHERGSIAHVLAERRQSLGLTGEQLDYIAGFADRYTAKLETHHRPQGRLGFRFDFPSEVMPGGGVRCSGMGQIWMEALGLRMVLVDEATAASIGAVPAPPKPPTVNGTAIGHAKRRANEGRQSAVSVKIYEALDRTHVAKEAWRVAVIEHPAVEADPILKADAEAIEAAMFALYQRIGQTA